MSVIFSPRRIDDWLLRMNTNVSIKSSPRWPMMILMLVCPAQIRLMRQTRRSNCPFFPNFFQWVPQRINRPPDQPILIFRRSSPISTRVQHRISTIFLLIWKRVWSIRIFSYQHSMSLISISHDNVHRWRTTVWSHHRTSTIPLCRQYSSMKSNMFVSLIFRKPFWATFHCPRSRTTRNFCSVPSSCVRNSYATSFCVTIGKRIIPAHVFVRHWTMLDWSMRRSLLPMFHCRQHRRTMIVCCWRRSANTHHRKDGKMDQVIWSSRCLKWKSTSRNWTAQLFCSIMIISVPNKWITSGSDQRNDLLSPSPCRYHFRFRPQKQMKSFVLWNVLLPHPYQHFQHNLHY